MELPQLEIVQLGVPERAPIVCITKPLVVHTMEANVVMGAFRYLPYSTGLLRSYALTDPILKKHVQFTPFLYEMDTVANIWKKIGSWPAPDVFAFSVSMWNEQLNLAVAKSIKETYGKQVLVVFGGCHVPHHPTEYMEKHPFIDVCVRAEGEEPFRDILLRRLEYASLEGIPDVTYRIDAELIHENTEHRDASKNLDVYPSPYTSGYFDYLLDNQTGNHRFQAIIETNRGCSFPCSFCYWGRGGLTTRYRFHSLDYVKDEISFTGRKKISYVFGADANFGMHPRDKEIAEHVVKIKKDYGYPSKFRVCFGKNTDDKIFQVASILHEAELEKGITLARQSNDETTLKNIRRDNIKLSTYQNLQKRFTEKNVPTYTELILGLPGETTESWKKGIDEILTSSGLKANLFVYLAQVLPNTELWQPEYRTKHGIKTKLVELTEIHGSQRPEGWIKEYEEIVIATNSMPYREWREMCKFSWATMLLHSMKSGFFVMAWLWDRFKISPSEFIGRVLEQEFFGGEVAIGQELDLWENLLDKVSVLGESRGQALEGYGDIYWDVEEAALLRLTEHWHWFYEDMVKLLWSFLAENKASNQFDELVQIVQYQKMRMPAMKPCFPLTVTFDYNLPEYFHRLFSQSPITLEKKRQTFTAKPRDFAGDKERFARETILWGRKSGTMLVPCEWNNS